MMPANVFQLELAAGLAGRRALALRLGVPALLSLPLVTSGMAMELQASVVVVLLMFPTFLGSAVATCRRRSEGHWRQLAILPIPRWRAGGDFLLASAAIDLLQSAGVVGLFAAVHARGVGLAQTAQLAGWLAAAVLALNAGGYVVGWLGRSSGEVHLLGALAVGAMGAGSGLFGFPPRLEPALRTISVYSPLWRLREALTVLARPPEAAPEAGVVPLAVLGLLAAVLAARGLQRAGSPR